MSWWHDDSTVTNTTWLTRGGQPGMERPGEDGANQFSVASNAFAPSTRDEVHRQIGATWKTKHAIMERVGGGYRLLDPK